MSKNESDKNASVGIRVLNGIPTDLMAMSRADVIARLEQLVRETPDLYMSECGRTDSYVSGNDLRSMVEDIEWCLGLRA